MRHVSRPAPLQPPKLDVDAADAAKRYPVRLRPSFIRVLTRSRPPQEPAAY